MKKFIIVCFVLLGSFIPFSVLALDNSDNKKNENVEDNTRLISNAVSGILIEANSGKILFEKEKDKQVPIASMTKMVAQIIILENIESGNIKWTDTVTVSKNAADMGGSQIYISEGEKISIRDLMKGISMASGNDATVQMAEVIAGSEVNFVKLMNKKVKDLGLKNTYFKNCTGLDEDGHYSTAYDMAMIARELVVNHPDILKFSSIYEDYLREDTKNKFWLVNTNKLVRYYEGADGLKTGHTDNAKYCLAATAKRKKLRLIAIVLGEENGKIRNNETMALLDYGFNSVKYNLLKEKGTIIKQIHLDKSDSNYVDIILNNDLGVIEDNKLRKHNYKYKVIVKDIKLPVKKNSVVGEIKVFENGEVVSRGDLIISKNINNIGYLRLLLDSIRNIITGIY
ncbi:MAG: D-alanyl-D-alanine carboxypeptidase [Firmicutes bacterium]|nr:D-alanyl-D-alanine carboxypeptidase [Bacillota bacterium]